MFPFEFDHLDWLSQFYSEWRQTSKLVNFQDFSWGPSMRFRSKFEKDLNFLILFHSSRKHLQIRFTFEFDHLDCLSQFYSEWNQTSKLVYLKISAKVRVRDFVQNLIMTKTSQFFSIHQENTCKSCFHSNLIILTDFHSFTVNEDKLQN